MGFVLMLLLMLVFPLRILRAAMLTQPPVTEVEEVRGLVHSKLLTAENEPLEMSATRVRRFHQSHRHGHATPVSPEMYLNRLSDLMLVEDAEQIV